jgi:hypothetical protein
MQDAAMRCLEENQCGRLGGECTGMVGERRSFGHRDLDGGDVQLGNHNQSVDCAGVRGNERNSIVRHTDTVLRYGQFAVAG